MFVHTDQTAGGPDSNGRASTQHTKSHLQHLQLKGLGVENPCQDSEEPLPIKGGERDQAFAHVRISVPKLVS